MIAAHPQQVTFFAELLPIDRDVQVLQEAGSAQQDCVIEQRLSVGDDRQLASTHLLQMKRELLGRESLGRYRVAGHDDHVFALASLNQRQRLGRHRPTSGQQHHGQQH